MIASCCFYCLISCSSYAVLCLFLLKYQVPQILLEIETTPLSISTSRKVTLLISKVQMSLSAGKIPEAYVPLLLNGIIGVFHIRFSYLWNPASECLALLISENVGLVWEEFINYFGKCLTIFQASNVQLDKMNADSIQSSGMWLPNFCYFLLLVEIFKVYPTIDVTNINMEKIFGMLNLSNRMYQSQNYFYQA